MNSTGNRIRLAVPLLALITAFTAISCESPAMVAGPSLSEGWRHEEFAARVDRVDRRDREISLRTDDGRMMVVSYDPGTRLVYRGREYPIANLEPGDVATFELRRNSWGHSHAYVIRIRDTLASWPRGPVSRVETLAGRVEGVDYRNRLFDLQPRNGRTVTVVLPNNSRSPDLDHFRWLRSGDNVRVEGQFIGRDRFELVAFLIPPD